MVCYVVLELKFCWEVMDGGSCKGWECDFEIGFEIFLEKWLIFFFRSFFEFFGKFGILGILVIGLEGRGILLFFVFRMLLRLWDRFGDFVRRCCILMSWWSLKICCEKSFCCLYIIILLGYYVGIMFIIDM